MQLTDKYSSYIIQSIFEVKHLDISEIRHLECIYSSLFDSEFYSVLLCLLKQGQVEYLPNAKEHTVSNLREYLYIYSFIDEHNRKYFATIYDSDELWQNPKLIDVITVK